MLRPEALLEAQLDQGHEEDTVLGGVRVLLPVLLPALDRRRLYGGIVRGNALRGLCVSVWCLRFAYVHRWLLRAAYRYFSTSCASLSEFSSIQKYEPKDGSPMTGLVYNNYTRGTNLVSVDASSSTMYFLFERSALRESLAAGTSGTTTSWEGGQFEITGTPKAATEIMGFDVSCQQAIVTAYVPSVATLGQSLASSQNGVTVRLDALGFTANEATMSSDAPRFKEVVFVTEHGECRARVLPCVP